eukprot:scaffold21906_cov51-Attheya_sp.AAC.1
MEHEEPTSNEPIDFQIYEIGSAKNCRLASSRTQLSPRASLTQACEPPISTRAGVGLEQGLTNTSPSPSPSPSQSSLELELELELFPLPLR